MDPSPSSRRRRSLTSPAMEAVDPPTAPSPRPGPAPDVFERLARPRRRLDSGGAPDAALLRPCRCSRKRTAAPAPRAKKGAAQDAAERPPPTPCRKQATNLAASTVVDALHPFDKKPARGQNGTGTGDRTSTPKSIPGSSMDAEIPAKGTEISDGGDSFSVDRLSALPDDILIHILDKLLDAAVAAQTSVLSSRWRRLWKLLPGLVFDPDTARPQGIGAALESHQAPVLHSLFVALEDASPESVAAWLPIAARRLSGDLAIINMLQDYESVEGGAFELPCFENATSMYLMLDFLGVAVPPSGVFAGLTDLHLSCVTLHGPCMLGDLVSSPRCPVLRTLVVDGVSSPENFAIHSDSLLEIVLQDMRQLGQFTIHSESLKTLELRRLRGLRQLNVRAPALIMLSVDTCFVSNRPAVADISAPQLESLCWNDAYGSSSTHFGNMEHVNHLSTGSFLVYGDHAQITNSYCVRLLRRFQLIRKLRLNLVYPPDITNTQFLMEDITRLPDIADLSLFIKNEGHYFGASVFHVLSMCTDVRRLELKLTSVTCHLEEENACPSGCVCNQPANWKTEELMLNFLKEVEVSNLRGTGHEAALVKRLFDWATVLETMTVTFYDLVAESKAKEFCQMLQSFSRPEICLKGPHFA